MKSTDQFKQTIKAHLDKRAGEDTLFAASYAREGKNLDDCCTYILNQVQKSGYAGFDDSEIFGMAAHYYDENVDVGKPVNAKVVVNHTVNLTDEEKEQARQDAIKKYQEDSLEAMKKKAIKPAKKREEQNVEQASLFD